MRIVSLNLECSQTISYNEFIIYPGHGFYEFFYDDYNYNKL